MIKIIIRIFKRFAWFKRLNAKVTYELLAKRIPVSDWHFMNYGYVPNPGEAYARLSNDPKIQRNPLQMYHCLAMKTQIEGKDVLEVGSGRGGGARHIAETMKPAFYTGMDLAQSAVDLANKMHVIPNLRFIQGSAEAVPFRDASMDVVINVESCHAYGCVDTFLTEVRRVLRPGGYFLMVDFRSKENMEQFNQQIANCGLCLVEKENISSRVVRSIEEEEESKRARINSLIPKRWRKLFSEFAGVVGSRFYLTLKNEQRFYYRFVMRKSE